MRSASLEILLAWPAPNYINPERRGPELWIVTAIFPLIGTLCVALRLYSRIFVRRYFGLDDALIILAWLSCLVVTIGVSYGHKNLDWDKHSYDMHLENVEPSLKCLYTVKLFWGIASSLVRLSILCLYHRLVNRCQAPTLYKWILHIFTFCTIALFIVYLVTGIMPCRPIYKFWSWPPEHNAPCLDDGLLMQTAAILNTISELIIAILPCIAVFKLKIDPHQRWAVLSLLSLGFLVVIAGSVRTYYVFKIVQTYDLAWWSTPHWLCSEVEIYTALSCACAAPLRPLIGRFVNRVRGVSSQLNIPRPVKMSMTGTTDSTLVEKMNITSEDAATWCATMDGIYQTVDLEGIRTDDGYGYTVIITGPPREPKPPRNWMGRRRKGHKRQDSDEHQDMERSYASHKSNDTEMEIVATRTFDIT